MKGHLHPLTILTDMIVSYFESRGFEIASGPEIETEEYNFDKLNIGADHPARDDHDTFYLEDKRLMRTHVSPMQLRYMEDHRPPVRLLVVGRSFRNEATDSTHNHTFYQVEGLVLHEQASFAQLLGTLEGLINFLFNESCTFRQRTSYFPFVEPGIELDIRTANGRWLEVLGAGMVHPTVLKNMGLNPSQYQGFAFGIGLERLLKLISGVDDVRLALKSEYRFLAQY